ncbi:uncharacterized protein At2g02148 isoform X2 [Amaranthus tricolor]|uniref:uncharacterized protein At2g02148 isoform X2 n=1 Tax=Amaranthus tricolor TaxID=29722 RepID=UPI00258F7AA9|nr:uncharacterized protein At2g02148 isoform X2 [Amaranthus tricolor]
MGTRVPINDYDVENNSHNVDNNNLRSADSYIDESNLDDVKNGSEIDRISNDAHDALTEDSLDQDEGSNNGDCLVEVYKNPIQIPNIGVDDDQSSLESSGSLRKSCSVLTANDLMPIETARAKFLQIVVDNFIGDHIIEKGVACIENGVESVDDKSNKRKSTEYHYEGDPRFVLPLMYVANLYETLVGEVNMRLSPLNGLREKTIGVALEASGGLYRKLTQKFPKTGCISFRRRELATSHETRNKFPELVVQDVKRVRFVVANGLEIIEKPNNVPADDAEWFKRLTGRTEVAITSRDYKFYNPRHKVRRTSSNTSPIVPGLLSYNSNIDHELQSATEGSREQETPAKHSLVTMCRQPQYQPVILNNNQSVNQNQQTTLVGCPHESGQSSHLSDMAHGHESPTFSQSMASLESLGGSHIIGRLNMMPTSPAKFCDECGSPYLRPTSKFCSQCGTKRFGI